MDVGQLTQRLPVRVFMLCQALALVFGLAISNAHALDLAPRTGVPPPSGVSAASISVAHRSFEGTVAIGDLGSASGRVDRQNVSLRYGRSGELSNRPVYTYINLPLVDFDVGGSVARNEALALAPDQGVGDIAVAAAIWPYTNREAGRFLGVAGYLVLPTGEYDSKRTVGLNLNPGNNRFAAIIQTGWHQELSDRWAWSIAADVMFFEDNDEYIGDDVITKVPSRFEVKPYASYQSALSYQANSALTLAMSYYVDRGAESRNVGSEWGSAINRERYGLWALMTLSARTQLNLSYKSTIDDASGLELKENVQLRLIRFF